MRLELNVSLVSPEELQRQLTALTCERQRLREAGETRESLERNRLEIARRQHELSHALIRLYLPRSAQRVG
jgi:hypothetical protein